MPYTVKMKTKFQMLVPTALCKQLGIKVGDFVNLDIENGVLVAKPMKLVEKKSRST